MMVVFHMLILLNMFACLVFIGYAAVSLVTLQVEIADKKHQLNEINEQIAVQQDKNDELKQLVNAEDDTDTYERIAREQLGYAYPDERVYYVISGN